MRRSLVVANWKMNGLKADIHNLLEQLLTELDGSREYDVVICPSSLHIDQVQRKLKGSSLKVGAQNSYIHDKGAFTGEISARMLAEFKCSHVIVGHSERRALFAESNELVAEKLAAAQLQDITPILCLGESLEARESGETQNVILEQLSAVIDRSGVNTLSQAVIAYEPIWAIGTGLSASPEQAQEVHELIRNRVASLDTTVADNLVILYGGSVKAANAASLFAQPDIDGALVGGASLIASEFISICSSIG